MPKHSNPDQTYTERDIGRLINNAVIAALHPEGHPDISPIAKPLVQKYAMALVEVLYERVATGEISLQAMRAALLGACLCIHRRLIEEKGLTQEKNLPAVELIS